jgi:hypothetical protein
MKAAINTNQEKTEAVIDAAINAVQEKIEALIKIGQEQRGKGGGQDKLHPVRI